MKKPIIVLMIIVLSVFMSANVTMAKGWKYFKGTYAMSATGSCIHSENGYVWGTFIDAVMLVLQCRTALGFLKKMEQGHIPIQCTLQSPPRFSHLHAAYPAVFVFSRQMIIHSPTK